jgi:transposase
MFCLKVRTLYHIYKEHLSSYRIDIEEKRWCKEKIEVVNKNTGGVSEQPLYVFKPENIGENMSIDDKAIGHDGFTVLSNSDTGKIAMLVETTTAEGVEAAMGKFGVDLQKIKNVSMDMSPTYALVFNDLVPRAIQVADKFHVMKYVYEAVGEVRKRIVRDLQGSLSKGKIRSEEDQKRLVQIEQLRRIRHAITQSSGKWNREMEETIYQVFTNHEELKTAYQTSQDFKRWYNISNQFKTTDKITADLHQWYLLAAPIEEFKSVIKMLRKHESQVINYFRHGATNAKAERLNGKIQRFITNNYGLRNKDFFMYRTAGYFAL